jgi:hypothetical protein
MIKPHDLTGLSIDVLQELREALAVELRRRAACRRRSWLQARSVRTRRIAVQQRDDRRGR